jgi:hypothetical protein
MATLTRIERSEIHEAVQDVVLRTGRDWYSSAPVHEVVEKILTDRERLQ